MSGRKELAGEVGGVRIEGSVGGNVGAPLNLKARIFMPRSDMPEILLMAISND
jgi:hypothetical protein